MRRKNDTNLLTQKFLKLQWRDNENRSILCVTLVQQSHEVHIMIFIYDNETAYFQR